MSKDFRSESVLALRMRAWTSAVRQTMFNPGKFDNDVAIYRKPIGTSAMLGRV